LVNHLLRITIQEGHPPGLGFAILPVHLSHLLFEGKGGCLNIVSMILTEWRWLCPTIEFSGAAMIDPNSG
jgi:hypothetical protein